jgi:hypothetical protein
MGRSYWFECGKCGYRAKVSGRSDRGLHFCVQTVVCRDCRQLYDVVTRLRVPDDLRLRLMGSGLRAQWLLRHSLAKAPPAFQAVLNRLPYRGVRWLRWIRFRPQCPVSALHRVQDWNDPDRCPRCGLHLEKSALPYRIWE